MNPRNETNGTAALFLVAANETQTPYAPFLGQVEELYSFGIDQAIAMEKVLLEAVMCLNSCVLDFYQSVSLFTPAPGNFFASAFASCMEMHINCLALLSSHDRSHASSVTSSGAQTTSKGFAAHHMDIAIGSQHTVPAGTVARSRGTRAQPTEDVQQDPMDIAMGSRKRRKSA